MSELPPSDVQPCNSTTQNLAEPIRYIPADGKEKVEGGMALCLSGGGYRAMLFHTGVLLRLNDLTILSGLKRISSVSGGSITSGVLATRWKDLKFEAGRATNLEELLVGPIRNLASQTIDWPSVILGLLWFGGVGGRIANQYRKYLFGEATLQDIPSNPRFIFNATGVQSGVLCRFSQPYMWDYRIGKIEQPKIPLAIAIAASSAFPPFLSPMTIDLKNSTFVKDSGTDLDAAKFQERLVLTDGGVYDNLGVETAWKRFDTILVSDAGGSYEAEASPHRDWGRHTLRTLFTIDNQVRSLRRRQIVGAFRAKPPIKKGSFWSIASDFSTGFGVPSPLPCPIQQTEELAKISTRLGRLPDELQMRLINWGYAACDISVRKFLLTAASPPLAFPYPKVGV